MMPLINKIISTYRRYRPVMTFSSFLQASLHQSVAMRCDAANIWRGRCIEEFGMVEAAVSETLAYLAAIPGHGAKMVLPHLIGQRFAALKAEVSEHGSFAQEGYRVFETLDDLEFLYRLRTFLCHGSSTVTLNERGEWSINMRLLDFRNGKPKRDMMELTEHKASQILEDLTYARLRLEGQLRAMLAAFRPSAIC